MSDNNKKQAPPKMFGKPKGAVEELGNNIYKIAKGQEVDQYKRITNAIADHVGRLYGAKMHLLVKERSDKPPEKPNRVDKDADPIVIKEWEKDYDRYLKKLDLYEDHKSKVFIIIKGQCSLAVRNKVEALTTYSEIEEKFDVVELLDSIRIVTYEPDVHYDHKAAAMALRRLFVARQGDTESLDRYYQRFEGLVEVAEIHFGSLVPTAISKKERAADAKSTQKDTRNKFVGCMFIEGSSPKKYGKYIADLNNDYNTGTNKYPPTLEAGMEMLSSYVSPDGGHSNERSTVGTVGANFATYLDADLIKKRQAEGKCFKCGADDHISKNCKNGYKGHTEDGSLPEDQRESAGKTRPSHAQQRVPMKKVLGWNE